MTRLLSIPILLGLLVVAAFHFSVPGKAEQRADFTFVNRGDNKCLDPNGMSWMQDIRIAYGLWEGLYTLDPVTLRPIPGAADKIDLDFSHTIYTFHLRDNGRWSNGDPVTANDFVFAWRRMLETPGDYTDLHFYIKGAQDYQKDYQAYTDARSNGPTTMPAPDYATVGVLAIDSHTLRVTLDNPVPFFPALCAFPPFFPLHEPSMRQFAHTDPKTGKTTYDQTFTRPPHLVTNGPYRLDDWTFKRRLHMVASDYYWDKANVKCRTIDQMYADDPLAPFRMYDRDEVDWLADVDLDLAASIVDKGGRPDMHIFPAFGTYYYSFNCNPKLPDGRDNPLIDVRVRQALAMAIDKTAMVRFVGRLGQPVATAYIPRGVFDGYVSPPGLAYDVARAKKLLADAGYPDGRGFPRLTILYNNEGFHVDAAQVVRSQWLTHLGIDVGLEGVEIKIFGDRLHSQQYEIARAGWYGDYDDLSTFTDKYTSTSDGNDAKWSNADYDRFCEQAQKEIDPGKRMVLLSKAEDILLQQAPIVPLFQYASVFMFRDNVKGIPLDRRAMVMFKSVKVER